MNLQPKRETITVQREFLNTTQGTIAKVAGLTLDAAAFGGALDESGYLLAGSAVAMAADGTVTPWADDATGIPFITQHDVKVDGTVIVGALEEAYLKRDVVTTAAPGRVVVTDAFIAAANGRFHLR